MSNPLVSPEAIEGAVVKSNKTLNDILEKPAVATYSTMAYILDKLNDIPQAVIDEIPDPLEDHDRLTLAVMKTLQVIDANTTMVVTESVAVPALEHEGPDIQYHHVPCTDELKDLPKIYWDMVNS